MNAIVHQGDRVAQIAVRGAIPSQSPKTIREAWAIFLQHGSPLLLLCATVPAVIWRIALGDWSVWDAVIVAAIVAVWPVQEWLIHVFLLHAKPITLWGRTVDLRIARMHRTHHGDPWNYRILFIPLHASIPLVPSEALLWFGVAPTRALALTGLAASLALGLHYEWIHFLIHTRVTPKTRFYQRLWRNHRLHHFKNERYWFGVTRLEGDWFLDTAPVAEAVAISPTARTLNESLSYSNTRADAVSK